MKRRSPRLLIRGDALEREGEKKNTVTTDSWFHYHLSSAPEESFYHRLRNSTVTSDGRGGCSNARRLAYAASWRSIIPTSDWPALARKIDASRKLAAVGTGRLMTDRSYWTGGESFLDERGRETSGRAHGCPGVVVSGRPPRRKPRVR